MTQFINCIHDVTVAGLLVYVLNRLSNLSDLVSTVEGRISKIEGLLEGYFLRSRGLLSPIGPGGPARAVSLTSE